MPPKTFDDYVINSIVANNEFGISNVTLVEGLKSQVFIREEYPQVVALIKLGNLEQLFHFLDEPRTGVEYLELCKIIDQNGKEFIVTVYDSDELWQDPQVIDIFPVKQPNNKPTDQ